MEKEGKVFKFQKKSVKEETAKADVECEWDLIQWGGVCEVYWILIDYGHDPPRPTTSVVFIY